MILNRYYIAIVLSLLITSIGGCKVFQDFSEKRKVTKEKQAERKLEWQAQKEAEKEQAKLELEESKKEIDKEAEINDSDSLFFSYEKTPCFGRCPSFKLKIYNSGYSTYDGTNFVDYIGFYKTNFDQTFLDRISLTLDSAGFYDMYDQYDNSNVMDLPSTIIEAKINGVNKKVIGRYNLPQEFKELRKNLDNIFENVEWEAHSKN